MTDNRIEQTTVANATEDKRLAPIAPGAGGWVPGQATPLWVSIGVAVLTALGVSCLALPALVVGTVSIPIGAILAAVIGAAATGIGTHYGIKSAGPRQP